MEIDNTKYRERGGNDPCIERLGSPTGILARMVHCLQTCWGLKLTLRLKKKKKEEKKKKETRQPGLQQTKAN